MDSSLTSTPRIIGFIPAAGAGARMGGAMPKQYLPIAGVPMLFRTVATFLRIARISELVVILSPEDDTWAKLWPAHASHLGLDQIASRKLRVLRVGGASRQASVSNGLHAYASTLRASDWALVHDAARPCVTHALIEQFLDELVDEPVGGLLALPMADTLKQGADDLRVERTVPRENLWRAQTPQMFRYADLVRALAAKPDATDESSAMEAIGKRPKLILGDATNLKVTYASDLKFAEMLIAQHGEIERSAV
jgi:2-C-methyl-D-erythritol 4-phosphate cytidylyltransferase